MWSIVRWVFLFVILIWTTITDIKRREVPDTAILVGIGLGLIINLIEYKKFLNGIFGFLVGGGVLLLIAIIEIYLLKIEGMGGGDIKLMAVIGLFVGWKPMIAILEVSFILGAIIGLAVVLINRKGFRQYIPFVPAITLGTFLVIFFGKQIPWIRLFVI